MTTLPSITAKQQLILQLVYRYRFINRLQIQALFRHSDKKRVTGWLKDLRDKQYVDWQYDPTTLASRIKPATYYLVKNGIQYLRTAKGYPDEELRKRYRDSKRTPVFVDQCLLLTDCCVNLGQQQPDGTYRIYQTEADYRMAGNEYSFLADNDYAHPHLYYRKYDKHGRLIEHFLLEIADASLPHHAIRSRLRNYVEFLDSDEWLHNTGEKSQPVVLIACADKTACKHARRYIRRLLDYVDNEGIPNDIRIRLTTIEKMRTTGITGTIWEDT